MQKTISYEVGDRRNPQKNVVSPRGSENDEFHKDMERLNGAEPHFQDGYIHDEENPLISLQYLFILLSQLLQRVVRHLTMGGNSLLVDFFLSIFFTEHS